METEDLRVPGLHIPATILKQLIHEWIIENHPVQTSDDSAQSLVDYLLLNGKKYTLTNRKKLERYDGRAKREIEGITDSSLDHAKTFAGLWFNIRFKEFRFKGATRIREGSRDWATLRLLVPQALAFGERFGLSTREGFVEFIRTFHEITPNGRQHINFVAGKFDQICTSYEAALDIRADETPNLTHEMHLLYSTEVAKRTGISISYQSEPTKYVFFVYAKLLAKKYGITLKQYIQAQFEALDWANGIPTPNQLVASYAEERTVKWMAQNNVKKSNPKALVNSNTFWSKIKSYENNLEQ